MGLARRLAADHDARAGARGRPRGAPRPHRRGAELALRRARPGAGACAREPWRRTLAVRAPARGPSAGRCPTVRRSWRWRASWTASIVPWSASQPSAASAACRRSRPRLGSRAIRGNASTTATCPTSRTLSRPSPLPSSAATTVLIVVVVRDVVERKARRAAPRVVRDARVESACAAPHARPHRDTAAATDARGCGGSRARAWDEGGGADDEQRQHLRGLREPCTESPRWTGRGRCCMRAAAAAAARRRAGDSCCGCTGSTPKKTSSPSDRSTEPSVNRNSASAIALRGGSVRQRAVQSAARQLAAGARAACVGACASAAHRACAPLGAAGSARPPCFRTRPPAARHTPAPPAPLARLEASVRRRAGQRVADASTAQRRRRRRRGGGVDAARALPRVGIVTTRRHAVPRTSSWCVRRSSRRVCVRRRDRACTCRLSAGQRRFCSRRRPMQRLQQYAVRARRRPTGAAARLPRRAGSSSLRGASRRSRAAVARPRRRRRRCTATQNLQQ